MTNENAFKTSLLDRTRVAEYLFEAVKICDSWGDAEDIIPERKNGRYGVTVFFDTTAQAEQFRDAVKETTTF